MITPDVGDRIFLLPVSGMSGLVLGLAHDQAVECRYRRYSAHISHHAVCRTC